jgi:hypothetical protein
MANNIVPIGELVKAFHAAGITVERDTWTGYFNATRAIAAWNASTGQKKRLDVFLKTANTKEFIAALERRRNSTTTKRCEYSEHWTGKAVEAFDGQSVNARSKGTWMHETLFLKFSAWLNVELEVTVYEILAGVLNGTLIIQAPIYAGRDRKEVTVEANQPLHTETYMSQDYLVSRKTEFGW